MLLLRGATSRLVLPAGGFGISYKEAPRSNFHLLIARSAWAGKGRARRRASWPI
jgi:hypothetical protein